METTDASLEQKICTRTETRAGSRGQQAELGLPRSPAKNIDVEASIKATLRRQKRFDNGLNGEAKNARIEDRFVLDDDNVWIVEGAGWNSRHQRQPFAGDIAQRQTAELSPGKWVEKRGDEGRIKTASLGRDRLKGNAPAACPVRRRQTSNAEQDDVEFRRNRRSTYVKRRRWRPDRARCLHRLQLSLRSDTGQQEMELFPQTPAASLLPSVSVRCECA